MSKFWKGRIVRCFVVEDCFYVFVIRYSYFILISFDGVVFLGR